jgi:hypothetical protein
VLPGCAAVLPAQRRSRVVVLKSKFGRFVVVGVGVGEAKVVVSAHLV